MSALAPNPPIVVAAVQNPAQKGPAAPAGDLSQNLSHFHAAQLTPLSIKATGPLGVDVIASIRYDGTGGAGRFYVATRVLPRPESTEREMTREEMKSLLGALSHDKKTEKATADGALLAIFHHLLDEALKQPEPSHLFDQVRFAEIKQSPNGDLSAKLGIGVDQTGTVVDQQGKITFEQHVVMLKAGAGRPLNAAERASLAFNLEKYILATGPAINTLWHQLLTDAKK